MWTNKKTDSNIVESVDASVPDVPVVPNVPAIREVVKRHVPIAGGQFEVCYVQPIPLPSHIEFLQKLRANGLTLVKIPIDNKIDMLYISDNINRLLKQCNLQWDYTEELITNYQSEETVENREALLNVIKVVLDFCKRRNIEFLTESV